jgi:gamma-glutamylcyclotransferase (GGCT)/AIG2-like uncharacterized protein YtfP
MISARLARRDSLLFVYGTLRPFVDVEMARWLRRAARYVGPATTRGRLYDLGAYPGMRLARGRDERVVGDAYRVTNPRVFRVLDRYEREFARERCVVKLERRGCGVAWAYRYRRGVAGAMRIASGDYQVHRRGASRAENGSAVM